MTLTLPPPPAIVAAATDAIIAPPVPVTRGHSVWPWVEPVSALPGRTPGGGRWPKISIVTPNYNYADLLETTLRSVLMQDYPELEYVVIDDGSTDASVDIIRRYDDLLGHWETHANVGQYATINKGFRQASGEIFGWINSDDVYLPWTLRTVGAIFAKHPEVQWIVGLPSRLQDGVVHLVGKLIPYPRDLIRAGYFHGDKGGLGWIQQESCFWRRELWEKAGGLRPDYCYAADFELWTRFARHADLYAVSTLLGGFTHRSSQNRSIANRDKYLAEVHQARQSIAAGAGADRDLRDLLLTLARFERMGQVRGLRRLAKRLLSMDQFRGPVMKWDFYQARYAVESVPYFQ